MSVSPLRKMALAAALTVTAGWALPALAQDASVDQVYSAAKAGQVDQALQLMQPVLKDHPNSAKAHFVEAELLAKAHRYSDARTELAKAEQLKPGLPFASPHAVSELKQQLTRTTATTGTPDKPVVVARESGGFPWVPVIVIAGLVLLVVMFLRRRSAEQSYQAPPSGSNYYGGQPNGPQGGPWNGPGYGGPGYGGPGYGGYPPQGGGSGILGTLATGAAAGAGFAAGERIIDGMFGGHDRERVVEREAPSQRWDDDNNTNQDMGGNDFGISDSGSWDDGGSSGGNDDW